MLRTSLRSAVFAALASAFGGCAQSPPVPASPAPAVSETAAASQPSGPAMMGGGHGMMAGRGTMGPGITTDGGPGMMGGGAASGRGMMDGGPGMMGGHGMMDGGMTDMMGMRDQCPMLVAGTTVQAKETTDGMSMTFTTTGDVAELKRRAHVVADTINAHSSGASGGMGMHGMTTDSDAVMGVGGAAMGGTMPALHAQVEEVDHGARLKMTPADPAKLGEMRQHMKQRAQMMNQSHGCSMMPDAGS